MDGLMTFMEAVSRTVNKRTHSSMSGYKKKKLIHSCNVTHVRLAYTCPDSRGNISVIKHYSVKCLTGSGHSNNYSNRGQMILYLMRCVASRTTMCALSCKWVNNIPDPIWSTLISEVSLNDYMSFLFGPVDV